MVVQSKVYPPSIDLNVIGEQEPTVFVDRAVDDFITRTDGNGFCLIILCFIGDVFLQVHFPVFSVGTLYNERSIFMH